MWRLYLENCLRKYIDVKYSPLLVLKRHPYIFVKAFKHTLYIGGATVVWP
jgi:hypothetical protein